MKIAVCVKEVPGGGAARRIDPQTKRLDRSGEAALNAFDVNAVEEALRVKEARATARSWSSRSARRGRSTRCARRSRWAPTGRSSSADDGAAGSDLVATSRVLAKALEREQRRPRPLRPAVLRLRRRRPVGGGRRPAAAAARLAGGRADGRGRQGDGEAPDRVRLRPDRGAAARRRRRLRRDQRAPVSVAEGDHGREVEAAGDGALGDLGLSRERRGRGRVADRGARARRPAARGESRKIEDDGTRAQQILDFLVEKKLSDADPRLPRAPRGRAAEGRARRARQGRVARRRRRRRRRSSARASTGLAARGRPYGAAKVYVAEDPALEAPLPQPRVDVLAKVVEDGGYDTVLFAASVLAADVAAGLAARLDAGLNWDLVDLAAGGRPLVGKRPALGDSVVADVGWKGSPAHRARPLGHVRARRERRRGGGRAGAGRARGLLDQGDDGRAGARGAERAVDRGRRRDRRGRPRSRRARELRAGRGAGQGARRRGRGDPRGRRRRLVPVRRPGRPDRQERRAEAVRRAAASRARSSTRSACRART